nr:carbohydrate sulfotransferase 15-like [Lytechinus pictus]
MSWKRFDPRLSSRSVVIYFLIAQPMLVCVYYNYVSPSRTCVSHSAGLNCTGNKPTRAESAKLQQIDSDEIKRNESKAVASDPLHDAEKPNPNPGLNYTISYQKATPANYTDLFWTDSEGNCRGSSCKWPMMPGATRELVSSAPEPFEKIPLHFLENFKNPCWLRGQTDLNCLPYFYVLGMYKSGTSEIWDKITAHPDVLSKVPKEPHWWGPRRNGYTFIPIHRTEILQARNHTGGKDDSSFEWCLNFYKASVVPELIKTKVTTKEGTDYYPKVFGEASVSTAYSIGRGWIETFPYAAEPPYTNADLMHALQPNAKFILMIRNPTKRADSFYWYLHNPGSADQWHERVVFYTKCFQKCIQDHNLRFCAYAADCPYDFIPNLQVGAYHVYIRDWMKVVPRDNFKVIRLEDWQADPVTTYRDLIDFLDLRKLTVEEENTILQRSPRNQNKRQHEQTKPETLKLLNDFYRPYNVELGKLMGDEKYNYPDYNG